MGELSELAQAICDMKEPETMALVDEALKSGMDAPDILAACREGMAIVGKRFEEGKYFIPELIFAGMIMQGVMKKLQPHLKEKEESIAGKATVVIGTVRDDIHDIGKDIVTMMLRGTGFHVVDLGVNVTPKAFVEAVQANNAAVVGMSVFLTSCCRHVSETVNALKEAGLREKVSVMIGGAAASDMVAERTGCDAFGATAVDAVSHAVAFTEN